MMPQLLRIVLWFFVSILIAPDPKGPLSKYIIRFCLHRIADGIEPVIRLSFQTPEANGRLLETVAT